VSQDVRVGHVRLEGREGGREGGRRTGRWRWTIKGKDKKDAGKAGDEPRVGVWWCSRLREVENVRPGCEGEKRSQSRALYIYIYIYIYHVLEGAIDPGSAATPPRPSRAATHSRAPPRILGAALAAGLRVFTLSRCRRHIIPRPLSRSPVARPAGAPSCLSLSLSL
jgi:hypothetical protein